MKKFDCNGKKDFCEDHDRCSTNCRYFDGSGGEYREVPMTNADRIRAMSDEEMAVFLYEWSPSEFCGHVCPRLRDDIPCKGECFEMRKEWLQQPCDVGDNA